MNATLADITCDSDGKIDKFINPEGGEPAPVLRLHALRDKQPYYLAMFLTGVYQEVLGSVHNMLGSTNCVVVRSGTRPAASLGEPRHLHCKTLYYFVIRFHSTLVVLPHPGALPSEAPIQYRLAAVARSAGLAIMFDISQWIYSDIW